MSFFIADAIAQTEVAKANSQFDVVQILMLGGLFAMMYFLLIRPQKKRQKEHEQLTASIGKGDEVVLTSGMLGKVVEVGDIYLSIDVGSDVKLKFQKAAVHAVLPKGTIKSI
jgi:preprotein translocase subunit YajC